MAGPSKSNSQAAVALPLLAGAAVASGLAWLGYQQYVKHDPEWQSNMQLLEEYEAEVLPPQSKMKELEDDILKELNKGLAQPGGGSIMMLPTFLTRLPDGHETGSCFAMDIGGTNFRVLYVKLSNKRSVVESMQLEQVAIPEEVQQGTAEMMFDFLAEKLVAFIEKHYTDLQSGIPPNVGFCFSFPVEQLALNSGKLVQWNKGFNVSGVIGEDVVALLSDALKRAGMPCNVSVLVNDTISVMAAARYLDPATEIGIILGTGTNAGIVLQVQDIPKWQPEGISPSTQTAINTEWGAYNGSQYLPNCKEDQELDKQSGAARGEMLLEKMVSGLYLGDIARRILATFAEKTQLLGKVVPPLIREQGSFTTAMLSKIESDVTPFRNTVARVVHDELGVPWKELTYARRLAIQKVCRMVVKRSARVFTAALMALLRQQKWLEGAAQKRVTIAVDGGVILKYANWRKYQKEALREALGDRSRELFHLIKLRPTPDGSGLGTAVLAAATMAEKGSSSAQ